VPRARTENEILERRARRLYEELLDEQVPGGWVASLSAPLLRELSYARRAVRHEGRIPRYGSLVFAAVPDWDQAPQAPQLVSAGNVDSETLRRFADGRSSFVLVTPEGVAGLASFEHSVEDEVSALRLLRTGAVVVQRNERGGVRVCDPGGVVLWTGSRWLFKPRAEFYGRVLHRLAPHADAAVLTGLLELAVHSLAAARVGGTFVWNLDGCPPDDRRGGLVELTGAITGPELSVARRAHFSAILSVASQVDLATIVAADGRVGPIGARLDHSARAGTLVAPIGGARHTSARRFTYDVPGVLAVVVSASGRVTAFTGGAIAAEISPDQRAAGTPATLGSRSDGEAPGVVSCGRCEQPLLVIPASGPGEEAVSEAVSERPCPVCGAAVPIHPFSIILGVPVRAPGKAAEAT
jgi:hypothetical protein